MHPRMLFRQRWFDKQENAQKRLEKKGVNCLYDLKRVLGKQMK